MGMTGQALPAGSPWHQPLDLYHHEVGDPTARPTVLLVGLGMQAIEWPPAFINSLVQTRRVICIDTRDAGKSPRCGPDSEPSVADVWLKGDLPNALRMAPYSLFDMRDDVLALLDRLKIDGFDLVGFSMGGMIGQLVAAAGGSRVGKFVQLASNDGTTEVDGTREAMRRMARLFCVPDDPGKTQDYLLDDALAYGAGRLQDTPDLRADIKEIVTRGYAFGGSARHALAVQTTPDRQHLLETIVARTLVLHGGRDPCIAAKRGRGAAAVIPNAQFKLLPMVGHILDDDMCALAAHWLQSDPEGSQTMGEQHGMA